jgi:hypothetical protein
VPGSIAGNTSNFSL